MRVSEITPVLGEKVVCATFFPHLYIMCCTQVQCYLTLRQLYSDFRDFSHAVCHVMKIIIAGSCDIGLCILQEGGGGGLVGGYLKTEGEGQVQKCIRLGLSQKILKREEG